MLLLEASASTKQVKTLNNSLVEQSEKLAHNFERNYYGQCMYAANASSELSKYMYVSWFLDVFLAFNN